MFARPPNEIASAASSVTAPFSATEIRAAESDPIAPPLASLVTVAGARAHLQIDHTEDDPYLAVLLASVSTQIQRILDVPMRFGVQTVEARWLDVRANDRLMVPGPATLPAAPQLVAALTDGTREAEQHELAIVTTAATSSSLAAPETVRVPDDFPAPPGDLDYWAMTYSRGWVADGPRPALLIQTAYRVAATGYAVREAGTSERAIRAELRALVGL